MKLKLLALVLALVSPLVLFGQEAKVIISRIDSSTLRLSITTLTQAISTDVEQSDNLVSWSNIAEITGGDITRTFVIPVNQTHQFYRTRSTIPGTPPRIVANSLAASVDSVTILSSAHINAFDSDSSPSQLFYTVSGVAGGRFERIGPPGNAVSTFTQADINAGLIRFVQDGSTTKPAYTLTLGDAEFQAPDSVASVSFCDGTYTSQMSRSEMTSFQNLIPLDQTTHTAVASGRWSDSSIWSGGNPPFSGAKIHIPADIAVVVDGQLVPEFDTIRIDGMLRFATHVDTRLKVDTLVTTHCARLEIGSSTIPIADTVTAELVFADDGPIDLNFDFAQLGRGAILHGKTVMHGQYKTPWSTLAGHPAAGATSVTLSQAPAGWKVGDQIVITGTNPNEFTSDESRTISAIDGAMVSFTAPLERDHIAPVAGLDVHIANTTRNIRLTSENPAIDRRGHVMVMHSLEADIRYVAFQGLGRTNKRVSLDDTFFLDLETDGSFTPGERTNIRGRYTLHFHRGGSDPALMPAHVEGCSVTDDPGWAYVNHSARVDFANNVSYNNVGGAFQTEAGDETGSFVNNIAIRTVNPDDPMQDLTNEDMIVDSREVVQDFAWQGDGFWIHGGGVEVRGNVVSGASGHGYIYWPEGLIEANLGMMRGTKTRVPNGHLLTDIDPFNIWWVPVTTSKNNTAYSVSKGLVTYYMQTTFLDVEENAIPQAYRDSLDAVFEGYTIWNTRYLGMDFNFTDNITVKNSRLVGTGAIGQVGIDANHHWLLDDLTFENVTIENFEVGFDVPSNGNVTIRDLTMSNATDFRIREPQRPDFPDYIDPVPGQAGRTMRIENINFANPESTKIQMVADFGLLGEVETGINHNAPKHELYFLLTDEIILNYGEFQNVRLYFNQQAPDFIPITNANATLPGAEVSIPTRYRNKTNQQLNDQYGASFGGELLPGGAVSSPGIEGGKIVQ